MIQSAYFAYLCALGHTIMHDTSQSLYRFIRQISNFVVILLLVASAHSSDALNVNEPDYGGIGVHVSVKDGYTTVIGVISDGPAGLGGLLSVSDKIIGIGAANNQITNVIGFPLSDVISLLRGEVDSEVFLQVVPEGGNINEPKQVKIIRSKVSFGETDSLRKVEALMEAAKDGDAEAQFELALKYNNGDGVPVSQELFVQWARAAAENGLAAAQFETAMIIPNEDNSEPDYQHSLFWLQKAAEQGHAAAENNLGVAYQNGLGVPPDNKIAIFWYAKSAAQGYATAQSNVGNMYLNGLGVGQDSKVAFEWFQKSANQGDAYGLVNLGVAYEAGNGTKQNYEKAFQLYEKAASLGNAVGQSNLALLYANGRGTPSNHLLAYDWYRKSADQGNVMGMHGFGRALYWGEGVKQDQLAGVGWLHKAAEQGYMFSQSILGYAYFYGDGVKKDLSTALKWNTLAAQQGDDLSQERLGDAYYFGEGIDQDRSAAYKWYLKSAMQGHTEAQYAVGASYSFGQGVPIDHEAATYWYKRAAKGGHDRAQFNLAIAYAEGLGIDKDDDEALRLYLEAAKSGHDGAQYNLGLMYQYGNGVGQDEGKAVEWLTKADESGHVNAKNQLALLYEWSEGDLRDERKAAELFAEAALQGSAEAALNLGLATSYGDRKNILTSLEYLKRAYKQGMLSAGYAIAIQYLDKNSGFYFPKAAYDILRELEKNGASEPVISTSLALLGHMHANGIYVEKNIPKALQYFERLQPPSVHSSALEMLVPTWDKVLTPQLTQKYVPHLMAYLDEYCQSELKTFGTKDFQENSVWSILRSIKSIEEDLVARCLDRHIAFLVESENLGLAGMRYQSGIPGVLAENPSKAFEYTLKSVESDSSASNASTMERLAIFYHTGYGTDKNDAEALSWRRKAADLGLAMALNSLGRSYEKGLFGLEANDQTALDYYQLAYEKDAKCSICITNLARAYERSVDEKDSAMAKILFTKAFELGNLEAGVLLAHIESEGLAGPENKLAAISILKEVVQGSDSYRSEVSGDSYNRVIKEARQQLGLLGGVDLNKAVELGNYHALVIGNTSYDNLTDLTTASRDAADVAKVLEQDYGFEVELLVNATRQQTLMALNRFKRDLKKNDNFLLYYAGHGVIDDAQEGFWLPTDSAENDDVKWIPNVRINRTLNKFKANNIILVADSCYAGAQFRALERVELNKNEPPSLTESGGSLIQRLSASRSRVAITSGGLEPVADRIGFSKNSVFASSFIRVLKNNSSTIPSGDLFKLVRQRVVPITVSEGLQQTPEFGQLWASGHEGGDFIFSRVR